MNLGDLGLLLQGVGSVLLAGVTALVGSRASRVLQIRLEGPLEWSRLHGRARRRRK